MEVGCVLIGLALCFGAFYIDAPMWVNARSASYANVPRWNNGSCQKLIHRVAPPQDATPLTALASFPGSGNTWLRYLIQKASCYMTGSVYGKWKKEFPGEGIENSSMVVVKTHYPMCQGPRPAQHGFNHFSKAILLVRDPFEAILAEFNREFKGDNLGHASPESFKSNKWFKFAKRGALQWEHHCLQWIKKFERDPENLLVVTYYSLKHNTEYELRRILSFLKIKVSSKTMDGVMNQKEGPAHRSKKQTDYSEIFNQTVKDH